MSVKDIEKHLSFMCDLDRALENALDNYSEAPEMDLEELRHMRREVAQARRSMFLYVEKRRMSDRKQAKLLEELFAKELRNGSGEGLLQPETAIA